MGFINNIRLAAQKYRAYRADIGKVSQCKNPRQRDKLNARAAITRREFLAASLRAARLPLALAFVGPPLAYLILARKTETIESPSKPNQNEYLKNIALNILQEVRANKSMSKRYEPFVREMIQLVEADKIIFTASNSMKEYTANHYYNSKNNILEMNLIGLDTNEVYFKADLIHELFHAYQDRLKKTLSHSEKEAEAHLAAADYLYQYGKSLAEAWINLFSHEKYGHFIAFNIPPTIIRTIKDIPFSSPEYAKAIKLIADNYLWMYIFAHLYGSSRVSNLTKKINRSELLRLTSRESEGNSQKMQIMLYIN